MSKYVINGLVPFPKRWRDKLGNITVMCEPTKGYVMCRRPGGFPFVLAVEQILNAEKHPVHGPFEVVTAPRPQERKSRT